MNKLGNATFWACVFYICQPLVAQVQHGGLTAQSGVTVNNALAGHTMPAAAGTSLPGTCSVGEIYFKTDAAAGQNLYLCTAANVWTQMTAGGALSLQDDSGNVVGTRAIMQILNGTYITCVLTDTGTKLTNQCEANTTKLVDRTQANTWVAGAKQSMSASASTAPLNLACGALPSSPAGGDLTCSTTNKNLAIYDATAAAWQHIPQAIVTLTSGLPLIGGGSYKIDVGTVSGSGSFVLSTSPTIATPTITSFVNAAHDHSDASNGGGVVRPCGQASFDGGGSALTAGKTVYTTMPAGGTLQAWNIVADTGTATIKLWRKATGTAIPTVSDSISTSGVSLTSGTAIHSTTLTDFTSTTFAANDIIGVNLTAVSSATYVNVVFQCK